MISLLSTDDFGGDQTSRIIGPILAFLLPGAEPATLELAHGVIRKLAHVTEYAILAVLLCRALWGPARSELAVGLGAFALSVAYAGLDEFHQTFEAGRVGAVGDVGFDALGAAIGVGLSRIWLALRR